MNFKKIQLLFGVLFVFVLILATNLIDQRNFEEMQDSIKTIYEDRLVAQDIIYDINIHIQNKDMANALRNDDLYISNTKSANKEIHALLDKYEETKLTEEEGEILDELSSDIERLTQNEAGLINSSTNAHDLIEQNLTSIKVNLQLLEQIQMEEGRRALGKSEKAFSLSELFTNMEICGLIILAIIFQVIILSSSKKSIFTKEKRNVET